MASRELTTKELNDAAGGARADFMAQFPGERILSLTVQRFTNSRGEPVVTIETKYMGDVVLHPWLP
jgi:hypothetical protein